MSSEDERLLAGRQVVAKILADDIKAVAQAVRDELEALIGARESRVAILPDGTEIGRVARSKPRQSAKVVDERALLAWVSVHRPDELVQSVRPSYLKYLMDSAKRHGAAVDESTGEIIPGIEVVDGVPSYTPTVDEGAAELVRARLAELIGSGILALPAGGGS